MIGPGRAAIAAGVAVAVCLAAGPARPTDDLGAMLDGVIATYGGPRAVARTAAFRVEAEVAARLRNRVGRIRREFQAPDRLRVEITYPGVTEVRILDGDRGWRGDATRVQRVTGLPRTAMVYQMLRSAVPWVFSAHRDRFEDRGRQVVGTDDYRLAGLPWSDQLDITYWINAVSRRVERVEAVLRGGRGRTGFGTGYRDFRRVDGVLVPFVEENYASGRHTGTTRVRSVVFSPPDLGPFDPGRLSR